MVVIPLSGKKKERWVAHRLFRNIRKAPRQHYGCKHPHRHLRLRPLPCRANPLAPTPPAILDWAKKSDFPTPQPSLAGQRKAIPHHLNIQKRSRRDLKFSSHVCFVLGVISISTIIVPSFFNPYQSLEPKQILFYCRADWLYL